MTSDITRILVSPSWRSRARHRPSKKKRHALSRDRGHADPRVQHCQTKLSNSLLKLCPCLSPSLSSPPSLSLFFLPPSVSLAFFHLPSLLRSIIVEHRSRRARYKCPSLSGSRNPQQLPSCLAILHRSLSPPGSFPFFRSCPKLNTLESERLNLSAITRSFPSSSIKASQDGSDGRSRGG